MVRAKMPATSKAAVLVIAHGAETDAAGFCVLAERAAWLRLVCQVGLAEPSAVPAGHPVSWDGGAGVGRAIRYSKRVAQQRCAGILEKQKRLGSHICPLEAAIL